VVSSAETERREQAVKCACPCGEEFKPKRSNQIYLNVKHRQRDRDRRWPRKRQSALLVTLTNTLEKRQDARPSDCPQLLGTDAQTELLATGEEGRLLNAREVARLLSVSVGTLKGWRSANPRSGVGPPFVRLGGHSVRYSPFALRQYLRERTERGRPKRRRQTV
jgi:predicted DNA-binding transcriptional regulator AlpA